MATLRGVAKKNRKSPEARPGGMPGRPREHVVETESRIALESLLPSTWTVEPVTYDYGLDARVEVFQDGQATGLAFWAPLKGTDEPNLRPALKRSFEVTALNYMASRADPVLLVRFHAPTKRLYGRWLHAHNVVLKKDEQKTITMSWSEANLLDDGSPEVLAEEVRRFRRFSGPLAGSLVIGLEVAGKLQTGERVLRQLVASRVTAAGGLLVLAQDGPFDVAIRLMPACCAST